MAINYKILGQAVNELKVDSTDNVSAILSELKIKNTSYPTSVDAFVSKATPKTYTITQNVIDNISADGGLTHLSGSDFALNDGRSHDGEEVLSHIAIYNPTNNSYRNTLNDFNRDSTLSDGKVQQMSDGNYFVVSEYAYIDETGNYQSNFILDKDSLKILQTPNHYDSGGFSQGTKKIGYDSISNQFYIGTFVSTVDSHSSEFIYRVNSDLSIDTSFTAPSVSSLGISNRYTDGFYFYVNSDRSLTVIETVLYNSIKQKVMYRLNTDGSINTSFGLKELGNPETGGQGDIFLLDNEFVYFVYTDSSPSWIGVENSVVRISMETGLLDDSFLISNLSAQMGYKLFNLKDSIIVQGDFYGYFVDNGFYKRFSKNGINQELDFVDISIAAGAPSPNNTPSFYEYEDNKAIIINSSSPNILIDGLKTNKIALIDFTKSSQVLPQGVTDSEITVDELLKEIDEKRFYFEANVPSIQNIRGVLKLPNGKYFVYGAFSRIVYYNSSRSYITDTSFNSMVVLNSDFTIDFSFVPPSFDGDIRTAILDNNQIIIGGSFSSVGGHSTKGLAAINLDGSVDTNATSQMYAINGPSFNPTVHDVKAFTDQYGSWLYVSGNIEHNSQIQRERVLRLNRSSFALDESYFVLSSNDTVAGFGYGMAVTSDYLYVPILGSAASAIYKIGHNGVVYDSHSIGHNINNQLVDAFNTAISDNNRIVFFGAFDWNQTASVPSHRLSIAAVDYDLNLVSSLTISAEVTYWARMETATINSRDVVLLSTSGEISFSGFLSYKHIFYMDNLEHLPNITQQQSGAMIPGSEPNTLIDFDSSSYGSYEYGSFDLLRDDYYNIPQSDKDYLIKQKHLDYDEEIKVSGGIVLSDNDCLVVNTKKYNPDNVIIQAYGIEETA